MIQVEARPSAYDQQALQNIPDDVKDTTFSFVESPPVKKLNTGVSSQGFVTIGSVQGADMEFNPDKQSIMSSKLDIEPTDNE